MLASVVKTIRNDSQVASMYVNVITLSSEGYCDMLVFHLIVYSG